MNDRQINVRLGALAIVASLVLIFFLIPTYVSSPSNVEKVILSPLFWPYALAGLTGLSGLALLIVAWRSDDSRTEANDVEPDSRAAGFTRLAVVAGMMVATMFLLYRLGLVLTSMLLFVALAYVVQAKHKKTAWLCAIIVPLALYAFFAHVAGVAIPQGNFLRLP